MSIHAISDVGTIDVEQVQRINLELGTAIVGAIAEILRREAENDAVSPATLTSAMCQLHLDGLAAAITSVTQYEQLHSHLLKVAGNHVGRLAFIGRNG